MQFPGQDFYRSRAFLTGSIIVVLLLTFAAIMGSAGLFVGGVFSLLIATFRHDSALGTLFPLALLFTIMLIFLTVLIGMLGFVASR